MANFIHQFPIKISDIQHLWDRLEGLETLTEEVGLSYALEMPRGKPGAIIIRLFAENVPNLPDKCQLIASIMNIKDAAFVRVFLLPNTGRHLKSSIGNSKVSKCSVCHSEVQHNDIFIFNKHNQPIHYVGRSCLSYFFDGNKEAMRAVELIESLQNILDICKDVEYNYSRLTTDIVETGTTLQAISHNAKKHNQDYKDLVLSVYNIAINESSHIEFSQHNKLTARVIRDWGSQLPPDNDYNVHIKRLCLLEYLDILDIPFYASIYQAYFDDMERKRVERERDEYNQQFKDSQHVGEMGQMTNIPDVEVLFVKEIAHEEFGVSWLYKMCDRQGNILTAFSRSMEFKPLIGDTIHIRCKIKEHSVYQSVNQTIVSHVKIISEEYARTGKPTAGDKRSKKIDPEAAAFMESVRNAPVDPVLGF